MKNASPPPVLDHSPSFTQALAAIESGSGCLFITGKAGTGKSTLLSYFCQNATRRPVVLAPTGVAALNVKGQTIHSFFNFYIDVTPQKIRDGKSKPRQPKLYKKLKTIIIDEISMVRADLLDCIDAFLRKYGPHMMQPFGGVQMIFIGDLHQLPPVVAAQEREIFKSLYPTPYFFSAQALRDVPLAFIELEKIYRQKDGAFVALLNKVRENTASDADLRKLNSRCGGEGKKGEFSPITLTATNQRADEINAQRLEALKGRRLVSRAEVKGDFTKDYFPTAPELQYKIGAQIMLLNNDSARQWVNGSIGVIEAIGKDEEGKEYLKIRLQDTNESVRVTRYAWEIYRFGVEGETITAESVGTFMQYPFRLAWAVTIHKSQGKTFERVHIDLGRGAFASGQVYVALSRCTAFEGITLATPIGRGSIRTDAQIHDFLGDLRARNAPPEAQGESIKAQIERAVRDKDEIEITYLKGGNDETVRTVRPLSLGPEVYKGQAFLGLRAFCTLRQEERVFSVDRILAIKTRG